MVMVAADRVLLTERKAPEWIDFTRLEESGSGGFVQELSDGRFRVRAKGQHCGIENRNHRVYPDKVWAQHLREGTPFQQKIKARGVIGHLEHPDDGKSKMPLGAVVVTEASPPNDKGEVWIVFETMSTTAGREVAAYISDRVRFGLSSRGNGSVQERNGVSEVQEDFDPITWDCVIDESTPGAEVAAQKLKETFDRHVASLMESAGGDEVKARALAEAEVQEALTRDGLDCAGGVCECQVAETAKPTPIPPTGFSKFLRGDTAAFYRAYQGSTGLWEVWLHAESAAPSRLDSQVPSFQACRVIADSHHALLRAGLSESTGPNISGMRKPKITVEALEAAQAVWPSTLKRISDSWRNEKPIPYSGAVLAIESAQRERALSVIESVGMVVSPHRRLVFSTFEGAQAKQHVTRVLESKGIDARVRLVGSVRDGIVEVNMTGIVETAPSGKNPGGMAGGNSVPDGAEKPDGISPDYKGDDPEDLDLDVDVNEEYGAPLDYDDDDDMAEMGGMDYDEPMDEYGSASMPQDDADDFDGGEFVEADDDDDDDDYGMDYEESNMGYSESYRHNVFEKMAAGPAAAMFAKANSADDETGARSTPKGTYKSGTRKGSKRSGGKKYYQDFRSKQAELQGYSQKGSKKPGPGGRRVNKDPKLQKARKKFRAKKRKENASREYSVPFNRILQETGEHIGAVRVAFTGDRIPESYEFYDSDGILESITDAFGNTIHAVVNENHSSSAHNGTEVWIAESGKRYRPESIIRMIENELPGRDGGKTGVVTKNNEYEGKSGGEYSMSGMNNPGDRGQDGSAQTPGDYDQASEEGDGEHVEKGTWPGSGGGSKSESRDDEYVSHLREKVAYLEDELARYESMCQEQHEVISGLREATRQSELHRVRAEAFENHPELRYAESRIMACESVSELNDEIGSMMSLVETVRSDHAPAVDPPALLERVNTVNSGTPRDGVPAALLNESSSPFSERLNAGTRIGTGDVASRVAAHRKRRRSR